jgi:hypothetical protein
MDFANRLVSEVIFTLEAHSYPSAGVVEYRHVSRGQMSASFVRRSSLTMTPFSVVKLIALASSMVGSVSMPATPAKRRLCALHISKSYQYDSI